MTDSNISTFSNEYFQCTKCKYTTEYSKKNNYFVIACPSCNFIHCQTKELYEKIPNKWTSKSSTIPLYTKGKMNEFEFKILGIAQKKDDNEKWFEYFLVDQFGENHIIIQWRGHFHYLKLQLQTTVEIIELTKKCILTTTDFTFKDNYYYRLSKYKTSTISFIGAFSYDLIDVKNTTSMDFVSPPNFISVERTDRDNELFIGRYLSTNEIQSIFRTHHFDHPQSGTVGMAQPFLKGLNVPKFNRLLLWFSISFTIFHIININLKSNETIITSNQPYTNSGKEVVSKPFILNDQLESYYITFDAFSNLRNQWIEDQITLVNERTGEEREFSLGLEYYSGVDSGYSWEEGSEEGSISISDVQPGKYHIKEKIISSSPEDRLPFYMSVKKGAPSNWNYWMVIISLALILLILNYRYSRFEEKRSGKFMSLFEAIFSKVK